MLLTQRVVALHKCMLRLCLGCLQLVRMSKDPRLARTKSVTEHSVASTDSSLVESEVAEVEMLLEVRGQDTRQ